MKWSFDDRHIGKLKLGGSSLETRYITRRSGFTNDQWYKYAQSICDQLNKKGIV